jgi:hypothetical protein
MTQNIAIFIHCALLSGCEARINSFVSLLSTSGLLSVADQVYICYVGDSPLPYVYLNDTSHYEKINIIRISNTLKDYEVPTLKYLYNFSYSHPNYKLLYIHTKNVGKELNLCVEDWIYYMMYYLVEQWKVAVKALDEYDTYGVDLRTEPTLHYSGNFWWTRASHILTLPDPVEFSNIQKYPNPLNSPRHNQEFWICYQKHANYFCIHDSGINCYQRHLHRYARTLYYNPT